ncbi:GNAT family N-acetyltransferase [Leifsonia shinshuensis]|uniref:GNAT family N-acetyltransferase n=1 Tax=Leifsonia shinshuensis TaxID=150026 RepID=A0A7G6Y917_9MICO|nr:GNAT family N-acetyltransferase [Leifsonia shinshuensis]QNE34982.1 GNAT family N-acetyltransferase [Leifsonia shinshuensis]
MPTMPAELTTGRLSLRLRDGRDAEWSLALIAEDPDQETRTVEEERDRLDAQRRAAEEAGFGVYAVELAETGEAIGYCGLVARRASAAQPGLAYELLRRHVGSGYATEAAAAVADAAFDAGFPVLWAIVERWNAPSFRVLDKLGFTPSRVSGDDGKVLVWLYRKAPRGRHRARG